MGTDFDPPPRRSEYFVDHLPETTNNRTQIRLLFVWLGFGALFIVSGFLFGLNNQTKMCAEYSPRQGENGHICVEDNPAGQREAIYYPPGMMP